MLAWVWGIGVAMTGGELTSSADRRLDKANGSTPMPRRNATTDRITFHKQKPIKQRKLEARLKGLRWHKWHYHLKSY